MKERGILMTPENAQKCYLGTKTKTRRVVKPQPSPLSNIGIVRCEVDGEGFIIAIGDGWTQRGGKPCPYGIPGDRLFIRECYAIRNLPLELAKMQPILYRGAGHDVKAENGADYGDKWRSAMFMPRWAARTVVTITSIRSERLHEISEADAKAEGIYLPSAHSLWTWNHKKDIPTIKHDRRTAVSAYVALRESIHGPGSWVLNPWVWVIEWEAHKP